VARVVAADALDDQTLGRHVGLGHEIDLALVRHRERRAAETLGQHAPRFLCRLDSKIKHKKP
jgi:hypothetical protein